MDSIFFSQKKNLLQFKNRRTKVLDQIKTLNLKNKKWALLLIADFESARNTFRQESSFYYLSGISEPAIVLCCYFNGLEILYLPFYGQSREQWVKTTVSEKSDPAALKVDQIKLLGQEIKGYSSAPFFTTERYSELVADLKNFVGEDGIVYTLMDSTNARYFTQMQFITRLQGWLLDEKIKFDDVSNIVHQLRRVKENGEINLIYKAVQITSMAMKAAAQSIESGKYEFQVQAIIEYVFKQTSGSDSAFPSIVATGKNTTILHSTDRSGQIKYGDLVVVDIGAEYESYASDLTRTFPAGGKFSNRQKEVYNIVLQTQQHIEALAIPGMYLNNSEEPEKSLYHQAVKFLQQQGYAQYFVHGIGHFLGLDVHDVGGYNIPLRSGDVFTIEPGIYIPQENIGIRIEDDYAMADNGVVCLSSGLPKQVDEIEAMMQG